MKEGGSRRFPPFMKKKGGGRCEKFDPVMRWGEGVQQVSNPPFSLFVAPGPLPVINDWSLSLGLSLSDISLKSIGSPLGVGLGTNNIILTPASRA